MPLDKSEIKILANSEEITQTAALEFTRHTMEEVRFKGLLTVALSGGSTPKDLYSLIASEGSSGFRLRVP